VIMRGGSNVYGRIVHYFVSKGRDRKKTVGPLVPPSSAAIRTSAARVGTRLSQYDIWQLRHLSALRRRRITTQSFVHRSRSAWCTRYRCLFRSAPRRR
jgi:hypothetical protein